MEAIETIKENMMIKYVDNYWENLFNRIDELRYNLDQLEQTLIINNNTKTQ